MHTDPELLSLFALGEGAGTEDDRVHTQTCSQCAGELSELYRLVTLGRSVSAETGLVSPSQHVWTRIRDELALDPALEPHTHESLLPLTAAEPSTLDPPLNTATAKPARNEVRRPLLAIIKAAVAGSSSHFENELTAQAQLAPVQASWFRASGNAGLATDERGRRLLQVTLQADLPAFGLRQAWLVHRDNPDLRHSLGILDGPHGLWTVDHSIDLAQYAILDITQQGTGQTGYSGHTIVRGQLTLTG